MCHWNRTESPEKLIFDRVSRIYSGERIVSSIKMLGKLDIHVQKNIIGLLSHIMHKNEPKWVKDLNTDLRL